MAQRGRMFWKQVKQEVAHVVIGRRQALSSKETTELLKTGVFQMKTELKCNRKSTAAKQHLHTFSWTLTVACRSAGQTCSFAEILALLYGCKKRLRLIRHINQFPSLWRCVHVPHSMPR